LLFIPNLVFIKEQFSVNQDTLIEYTISGRIKSMIMASFDFFSIEKITFLGDIGRWIFRIVFISLSTITLVIYFIKNQTQENKEYLNLSFVIIQTLALLLLFTATFIFTNMVYAIRYVTILFPFHILLLVIYGTYKSTLKNIFYGLYSVFLVITLLTSFCNPYLKSYNYKSIAKYTQKIQVKNEPVLFVNNDLSFGLKHLSENEENFINLPEYQFNYNLYNNFVKDTTQLNSLINNIKSKSQSYLVITGTDLGYMRSKNLTNSMIDSFLEYNFIVTSDTIIQGKLSVDFMRIRRILIKNQKL
jgi:hypothetical protein